MYGEVKNVALIVEKHFVRMHQVFLWVLEKLEKKTRASKTEHSWQTALSSVTSHELPMHANFVEAEIHH